MHVLVVTERVTAVCAAPTGQSVLVTPTPSPSPSPSSVAKRRLPDASRAWDGTEILSSGQHARQEVLVEQQMETPIPLDFDEDEKGHPPCMPFEEADDGSDLTLISTVEGGLRLLSNDDPHKAATTTSRKGRNARSGTQFGTVDRGEITLGGDVPESENGPEELTEMFTTARRRRTGKWNRRRGRKHSRSFHKYTREYVLCRRIVHALNARYLYATLSKNNTVPDALERVTQLYPGFLPSASFFDGLRLSTRCLLAPRDPSKPPTTTTSSYKLQALPINHKVNRSYSCALPCEAGNYYRHDPSGSTAEFIFAPDCKPAAFRSCMDTPGAPGGGGTVSILTGPTKTGARAPVPSIITVRDDSGKRRDVVRKAIRRLRRMDGFGAVTRGDVLDLKVRRRNGNVFVVILWFEQTFAQEF